MEAASKNAGSNPVRALGDGEEAEQRPLFATPHQPSRNQDGKEGGANLHIFASSHLPTKGEWMIRNLREFWGDVIHALIVHTTG